MRGASPAWLRRKIKTAVFSESRMRTREASRWVMWMQNQHRRTVISTGCGRRGPRAGGGAPARTAALPGGTMTVGFPADVLRALPPARSGLGCWPCPGLPRSGRHGSCVGGCLAPRVPGVGEHRDTGWGHTFRLWAQRKCGGSRSRSCGPREQSWGNNQPTPVQAPGKLASPHRVLTSSVVLRREGGGRPRPRTMWASPPCSDLTSSACSPASGWPAWHSSLGQSASPALGSVQGQVSGGRRLCLRQGFHGPSAAERARQRQRKSTHPSPK